MDEMRRITLAEGRQIEEARELGASRYNEGESN